MNRRYFTTSLIICLISLGTCINTAYSQAGLRYSLHEVPLVQSSGVIATNGMNHHGMLIGSHNPGGVRTGFIYDHYGMVGAPRTLHNLTEWIDLPPEYPESSCVGINDLGQVVGYFQRTVIVNGESLIQQVGFMLDLDLQSGLPIPTWYYLPVPPGSTSSYGRRINNHVMVIIESQLPGFEQYLWDSSVGGPLIPIVNPQTNQPLPRAWRLSDSSQILGPSNGTNPNGGGGYLLTPGISLVWAPFRVEFYDMSSSGKICGQQRFVNNRGITTHTNAIRYSVANGIETLTTQDSIARYINASGDVAGGFKLSLTRERPAMFHDDWGWIYLDGGLITGSASDLSIWGNPNTYRMFLGMSDRNSTGFGNLLARAELTTTTGKGKNAVTTTVTKYYYLQPNLIP